MYIPHANREDDPAILLAFMREHAFITLVSILDGIPFASHVPVALRDDAGQFTIIGHLAKANPQWRTFGTGEALAIFNGPHAYISPSLYEKHESVPTWNYIAVHAYGVPQPVFFNDAHAALEGSLRELIATYEAAYQTHWESLPVKFREGMLQGVVGFEIAVTRLEGKYKLSQNRSHTDQHTVAHALLASGDPAAQATGAAMQTQLAARDSQASRLSS
ncbi:MAG TPA: FMN-binding negative transcriptional regulator [Roseiflexaceae bacterium]|mgnify:CR=1 FL=1|nr:FMN-binding negative transcriptional regulator [Roseiflexaceae bacterium]HMP38985.1 FMN-binding negative transcriptional regulator [Roseiflexaceae bacterium]